MSLQTRLEALVAAVGADIKDLKSKTTLLASSQVDSWHIVGTPGEPAFQNGWVNYDSNRPLRFKKMPDGRVCLEGIIRGGALTTTVFTLPAGYRPAFQQAQSVMSNDALGQVGIYPTGIVAIYSPSSPSTWVDLASVEFDTGQASAGPVLVSNVTQEGWHNLGDPGEPAFLNGWVTQTQMPPRFRKDSAGRVTIEGSFQTGASGTVAFQLPPGYRPDRSKYFACLGDGGAAGNYVIIDAAGNFTIGRTTAVAFFQGEFWNGQITFPAGKSVIPTVDALPNGPTHEQEIYFQTAAMKVNGVKWHLQYDATAPGAYKWIVLGGSPLQAFASEDATESTAQTVYVALTTPGPSLTLPLAGDYDVAIEFFAYGGATQSTARMSYDIGATPASDSDSIQGNVGGSSNVAFQQERKKRKLGLAANTALVSKYRVSAGSGANYSARTMWAMPIRVG